MSFRSLCNNSCKNSSPDLEWVACTVEYLQVTGNIRYYGP
jgi:hypothetical protein